MTAPFSKVPQTVTRCLICGDCNRLYAHADEEQGAKGWPLRGINAVADLLSWQVRTAKRHVLHLHLVGIMGMDPPVSKGEGWGHVRLPILYNPCRGRFAALTPVAGVWTEEPEQRWKAPSRLGQFLTNAERDALGVGLDEEIDPRFDTRMARRASDDPADARRDMPSVARSRSEEVGKDRGELWVPRRPTIGALRRQAADRLSQPREDDADG